MGEKSITDKKRKKPSRILYTQRQIILVLFLERNCSHPLVLGGKKKMFLSQGQQHLESGGGNEEARTWKTENIYPEYFTQCSWLSGFFIFFFLLSRLEFVSVFITQIIHTSVKVTHWNIQPASNATENIVSQRSKTSGISQPLCIAACCHGQFLYTVCSLSH